MIENNTTNDKDIRKALTRSVDSGDVAMSEQLLRDHPELLYHDHGLGTWLHRAARKQSIEMVDMLLEQGLDINAEMNSKMLNNSPLICALYEDNPLMVECLLQRGADVRKGRPIVAAITGAKKNSLEMVKLLEKYGADIHEVFPFGEGQGQKINALSAAMTWGKQDVVDYLKSKGAVMPVE